MRCIVGLWVVCIVCGVIVDIYGVNGFFWLKDWDYLGGSVVSVVLNNYKVF